jgi:hypothetical protein
LRFHIFAAQSKKVQVSDAETSSALAPQAMPDALQLVPKKS